MTRVISLPQARDFAPGAVERPIAVTISAWQNGVLAKDGGVRPTGRVHRTFPLVPEAPIRRACADPAHALRWAVVLALCLVCADGVGGEATTVQAKPGESMPEWSIAVDNPIVQFKPGAVTRTTLRIQLPPRTGITSVAWEQQTSRINPLQSAGKAEIQGGAAPTQFEAVFSAPGVYQLQATLQVGQLSGTRKTWIQVWDATPATLADRSGRHPGITPPRVRQLSRDPGPFQHPRLLLTDQDWSEVSNRNQTGKYAANALRELRRQVSERLENATSDIGKLAVALNQQALKGGAVPAVDLARFSVSPGAFYETLLDASYLAWLDVDPRQKRQQVQPELRNRCLGLARLVSAVAKLHFDHVWDRSANQPRNTASPWYMDLTNTGQRIAGSAGDLALAYDFIYDWMNEAQQRDTRDLLFAMGYGRHGSGAFENGAARRGNDQNGDFANLDDYGLLIGLAVEGEESAVSPEVQAYFGKATQPWMAPAELTDPSAWPSANTALVDSLWRQLRWMTEGNLNAQGFVFNGPAYYGLSMRSVLPPMLALSRRGENAFITSLFYQSVLGLFLVMHPGDDGSIHAYAHQDGGQGTDGIVLLMWKYMYPEDVLVDYVYRHALGGNPTGRQVSMFGLDPGGKAPELVEVAATKGLARVSFDPDQSAFMVRNTWMRDDLSLRFTCGGPIGGHNQHAETNSFSLYALGRAWSSPPGYHITSNDSQSSILIQDPRYLADAATQGYLGQNPSSATQAAGKDYGLPPSGTFLEFSEDPQQRWILMAGDATATYSTSGGNPYNPVDYAIRTILMVRGAHPYVLVVDDIQKDGQAQNYRWVMNSAVGFGIADGRFLDAKGRAAVASLAIDPGATATQAMLYHECDGTAKRRPSLLVRELGLPLAGKAPQPAMTVDAPTLCYGREINRTGSPLSTAPSRRLVIDRNQVVNPGYTVLLYPCLKGEALPKTAWNKDATALTIGNPDGLDTIIFDRTRPDHRTRLTFSRK